MIKAYKTENLSKIDTYLTEDGEEATFVSIFFFFIVNCRKLGRHLRFCRYRSAPELFWPKSFKAVSSHSSSRSARARMKKTVFFVSFPFFFLLIFIFLFKISLKTNLMT
jgi:hypothetical protein